MIIETSANRFYSVVETGNEHLTHVWYGTPVKHTKAGWVVTAAFRKTGRTELVRKEATKVVEA